MKKLLTILLVLFSGLVMAQTGENPPSGTKMLQAPNSPTFLFYQPDTSIWISMGAYGKAELQRANKKYPIWNHTGISNTGWTPSKVLGFDVDGNLKPVDAGSGSMVYPATGIALSNGSGWAASLTDNSAIWNKAITSDATFPAANYLLKTADTGRKAVASGIYEDATGKVGIGTLSPQGKLHVTITAPGDGFRVVGTGQNSPQFSLYSSSSQLGAVGLALGSTHYSWIANTNDVVLRACNAGSRGSLILTTQNATGSIYFATGSNSANDAARMTILNNGYVGIGNTSPTARLHLPAGTATASTSPLKFTSGTNLTAPEAGAMEFDGSRLYFTPSTTRKTLSFDENFKTINGNSILGSGDLTISSSYVWGMQVNGGTVENTYDGNVWNLIPGTNISISRSGKDVTFSSTGGSMVYPGAGIAVSTGSAWGTSITDNSANWNTAASNIGQVAVGAQYPGGALGYLASSSFSNYNGIVYVKTATTLDYSSLPVEAQAVSHALSNYSASTHTHSNATTSTAGFMSATDKTNHDAVYSNMGKVTVGGGVAYGDMSSTYFSIIGGAIIPTRDSSPTDGSSLPITSNAVYDGLALKADLSGAAFTGAISSTSTMTATDFILQSSDRRLKKNIQPIKADWVKDVKFVQFRLKSDLNKRTRYGVIAQDLEKLAPDLVVVNKDGYKSVAYTDLLIAKIAELEKRIKQLEDEK